MTNPIRLALVITELEAGGAERCLVNLATRLDRSRFEPVVYSLAPRPAIGRDQLVEQLAAASVSTKFLDAGSKWQFAWAIGGLSRLLAEQRPQLVQTFLFHANVVGTLAARRAGVPHVLAGVRVADPRRWRTWLERRLSPQQDRIVCVSRSVADFCRSRGFPAEKLEVIPNGVDLNFFAVVMPANLAELGLEAGRKAIVCVGRLDPQKGLEDLLGIAPELFRRLPEHDLVLVGDGPLRGPLERRARQLGIDERVRFAGWRADVPAILAAAEMLVLPSRWEGMPNVVLEAMAAGKPVVATRAEGVMELLGDRADAQTVEIGDLTGLVDRVIQIAQNPHVAADFGTKNHLRAAREFSMESMVSKYERLFESVLAR